MMKVIFTALTFIAFTAGVSISANAQLKVSDNKQINFIENSWTEALKQAAAQNKYIFVDTYTTWCGPCKIIKATTFKNDKAAAFFNRNFVNVSIDLEKGSGPQLASLWRIKSIPTLIIFDAKGNAVLGSEGLINAKDLISFGEQALAKKVGK
jgi:thioredoxin 1